MDYDIVNANIFYCQRTCDALLAFSQSFGYIVFNPINPLELNSFPLELVLRLTRNLNLSEKHFINITQYSEWSKNQPAKKDISSYISPSLQEIRLEMKENKNKNNLHTTSGSHAKCYSIQMMCMLWKTRHDKLSYSII